MAPTWAKAPCVQAPEHAPVVAEPPPKPPTDEAMEKPEVSAQAEGAATQMAESVLAEEVATVGTATTKDINHPDDAAADKDKKKENTEEPVLDGENPK